MLIFYERTIHSVYPANGEAATEVNAEQETCGLWCHSCPFMKEKRSWRSCEKHPSRLFTESPTRCTENQEIRQQRNIDNREACENSGRKKCSFHIIRERAYPSEGKWEGAFAC